MISMQNAAPMDTVRSTRRHNANVTTSCVLGQINHWQAGCFNVGCQSQPSNVDGPSAVDVGSRHLVPCTDWELGPKRQHLRQTANGPQKLASRTCLLVVRMRFTSRYRVQAGISWKVIGRIHHGRELVNEKRKVWLRLRRSWFLLCEEAPQ